MTDYSMLKYWDKRFSNNATPYEWLKEPEALLPTIRRLLERLPESDRRILHIGSGSSALSLHLRQLVQSPSQIHNIDYSPVALEIGKNLEHASIEPLNKGGQTDERMAWTCLDLLNVRDISLLQNRAKDHGAVNMVLDKSTSDAIACGEPIELRCSEFDYGAPHARNLVPSDTYRIYPVWRLALHMAALTEPGAYWVTLSYKEDRFDCLDPAYLPLDLKGQDIAPEILPSSYWTVHSKEFIIDDIPSFQVSADSPVHRPVEGKWLIVLQRNGQSLSLKEEERN